MSQRIVGILVEDTRKIPCGGNCGCERDLTRLTRVSVSDPEQRDAIAAIVADKLVAIASPEVVVVAATEDVYHYGVPVTKDVVNENVEGK